jgi:hypothetical protein
LREGFGGRRRRYEMERQRNGVRERSGPRKSPTPNEVRGHAQIIILKMVTIGERNMIVKLEFYSPVKYKIGKSDRINRSSVSK